jgi:hypothetical protein
MAAFRMRRGILAFSIAAGCLLANVSEAGGPLRISNVHPLFIATGNPLLQSAGVEDSIGLFLTYSSLFLLEESEKWSAVLDAETAVLELEFRKRLGGSTEVGLTLPLFSHNSGFLDGFLDAYHDIVGAPNYGRERRPENDFALDLSKDGETVIRGEPGEVAPGDIKLGVKRALGSNMGIYGFLDLPTGDPDRGYGSGTVEWGAALLYGEEFPGGLEAYLNAGFVVTDSYEGIGGVELEDYLYGGAGIGWAYSEAVSIKTQLMARGSPFRTGIRELDTAALVWSMGGWYAFGGGSALEFSFSEDVNTAGAPDFMVGLGYRHVLGGGPTGRP